MAKYRKKPVVIEAFQWNMETAADPSRCPEWFRKAFKEGTVQKDIASFGVIIKTLEGDHRADTGDYIIQGVKGELYPCKPDIFEKTYVSAEGENFNFPPDTALVHLGADNEGEIIFATEALKDMIDVLNSEKNAKTGWRWHFKKIEVNTLAVTPK